MRLNHMQLGALRYIQNAGIGATKRNFLEDHEPIGRLLLKDLKEYYYIYDDILVLTPAGEYAIKEADNV